MGSTPACLGLGKFFSEKFDLRTLLHLFHIIQDTIPLIRVFGFRRFPSITLRIFSAYKLTFKRLATLSLAYLASELQAI